MNILELVDVTFMRKDNLILKGISFSVNEGDIIGLLGPSGSGKSSLLRMINLLHSSQSGRICYRGQDIQTYNPPSLRREIGYVLQKPTLFGATIEDNLVYPYSVIKEKPDFREIKGYLEEVNLPQNVLAKKVNELSGGEQQRIALIRSLLAKPKILLLDEVTASLDEANTLLIEKLILRQHAEQALTILFISHNTDQAKRLAEKILYLADGQIQFFGPKLVYFSALRSDSHE